MGNKDEQIRRLREKIEMLERKDMEQKKLYSNAIEALSNIKVDIVEFCEVSADQCNDMGAVSAFDKVIEFITNQK